MEFSKKKKVLVTDTSFISSHLVDRLIVTRPEMPTGSYNRVADNSLSRKLFDWEPKVKFIEGFHKTISWYFKTNEKQKISKNLL